MPTASSFWASRGRQGYGYDAFYGDRDKELRFSPQDLTALVRAYIRDDESFGDEYAETLWEILEDLTPMDEPGETYAEELEEAYTELLTDRDLRKIVRARAARLL